jgi:hypothetical protein
MNFPRTPPIKLNFEPLLPKTSSGTIICSVWDKHFFNRFIGKLPIPLESDLCLNYAVNFGFSSSKKAQTQKPAHLLSYLDWPISSLQLSSISFKALSLKQEYNDFCCIEGFLFYWKF